eukprot:7934097-Pyramimonas_sp.AAC.1
MRSIQASLSSARPRCRSSCGHWGGSGTARGMFPRGTFRWIWAPPQLAGMEYNCLTASAAAIADDSRKILRAPEEDAAALPGPGHPSGASVCRLPADSRDDAQLAACGSSSPA